MKFRPNIILAGFTIALAFFAGYGWRAWHYPARLPPGQTMMRPQAGEGLARTYCSACHVFPEPSLLTKTEWRHYIMPQVAVRMGVEPADYASLADGKLLRAANLYPASPMVSQADWLAIWDYYQAAAPSQALPPPSKPKLEASLTRFHPRKLNFGDGLPAISLVKIDSARQRIYVGDMFAGLLAVLDSSGNVLQKTRLGSAPVSIVPKDAGLLVTCIGRFFPSDALEGSVVFLAKGPQTEAQPFLTALRRPTDARLGDLNQDGLEDLAVCSFGNRLGQFAWYENKGDGRFEETVLLDRPGAIRCELLDFNRDGRLDMLVLMGQAREGLCLFLNEGQGRFSVETLLEQHPAFGYADFQVVDFDRDGDLDIITTNGDNGDNPTPHKPYHGIRLYLNNGRNQFHEAWFYPLEGAYKAMAADFDLDGDLDLAAIAYFPDFSREPLENFLILENQGALRFKAVTLPEHKAGRWMVMDVGDIDRDGDADIVLGSLVPGPTTIPVPEDLRQHWQTNGAAVLILENGIRQPE